MRKRTISPGKPKPKAKPVFASRPTVASLTCMAVVLQAAALACGPILFDVNFFDYLPRWPRLPELRQHFRAPTPCDAARAAALPGLTAVPAEAPASLAAYAAWHRAARACLSAADCAHRPDVLVWRCGAPGRPCPGLGDRLRGAVTAFFLAYSARRLFLVDWPMSAHEHFAITTALVPAAVDWRVPDGVDVSRFESVYWGKLFQGPQMFVLPDGREFDVHNASFQDALSDVRALVLHTVAGERTVADLQRNRNLTRAIPDVRHVQTLALVRVLYKTLFRSSQLVTDIADHLFPSRNWSYVSVHARLGEDVGETDRPAFASLDSRHDAVARSLLKCVRTQDATRAGTIFLASDSVAFKRTFISKSKEFGYDVFTSSEKALHLRRRKKFEAPDSYQQRCAEFLNIFVDLYLLGNGNPLVMTGSGFARAALFLGQSRQFFQGYSMSSLSEFNMCSPHRW